MKELTSGEIKKFEKKGDSISGIFICYQESRQYPGSYVVKLENDGNVIGAFVSGIVVDLLTVNNVKKDTPIMVEYQGTVTSAKGRDYKDYKVYLL